MARFPFPPPIPIQMKVIKIEPNPLSECNFTIEYRAAKERVRNVIRFVRHVRLTNRRGEKSEWSQVDAETLACPAKFRVFCLDLGNFSWGGGIAELQQLHVQMASGRNDVEPHRRFEGQILDRFLQHREVRRIVILAGPVRDGGKTTLARLLVDKDRENAIQFDVGYSRTSGAFPATEAGLRRYQLIVICTENFRNAYRFLERVGFKFQGGLATSRTGQSYLCQAWSTERIVAVKKNRA